MKIVQRMKRETNVICGTDIHYLQYLALLFLVALVALDFLFCFHLRLQLLILITILNKMSKNRTTRSPTPISMFTNSSFDLRSNTLSESENGTIFYRKMTVYLWSNDSLSFNSQ